MSSNSLLTTCTLYLSFLHIWTMCHYCDTVLYNRPHIELPTSPNIALMSDHNQSNVEWFISPTVATSMLVFLESLTVLVHLELLEGDC